MKRAPKAWSGGTPPELTPADQAFLDHIETCPDCNDRPVTHLLCEEGRALYLALHPQAAVPAPIPTMH